MTGDLIAEMAIDADREIVLGVKAVDINKLSDRELTAELQHRLAARHPAPAWAFLSQVRNGTGFRRLVTRTADAIAMSLYPSRGLYIHGFEVKATTADYRREVEHPDKAEDIARFCDFWWLVTTAKVIQSGPEVPTNWGVLVPEKKGLVIHKQATLLQPERLDRLFVAAILRNASEGMVTRESIRPMIDAARQAGEDNGKQRQEASRDAYKALSESVREFEKASGLKVDSYNGARLGEDVARAKGVIRAEDRLKSIQNQARHLAAAIDKTLAGEEGWL